VSLLAIIGGEETHDSHTEHIAAATDSLLNTCPLSHCCVSIQE